MDGAYAGKDQGPINMAEQYRFEDFTPEELGRLRQLYDTLGLDPLPINRGEESFNTLLKPEERRQLFEAVRGEGATPEALATPHRFALNSEHLKKACRIQKALTSLSNAHLPHLLRRLPLLRLWKCPLLRRLPPLM